MLYFKILIKLMSSVSLQYYLSRYKVYMSKISDKFDKFLSNYINMF